MLRIVVILLAFAGLCYWCITRHAAVIEQDVLAQAQAVMLAENTTTVLPTVDGRDVLLTGQVDTDAQRQRLLDAVASGEGVRAVEHTIALTPTAVADMSVSETDAVDYDTPERKHETVAEVLEVTPASEAKPEAMLPAEEQTETAVAEPPTEPVESVMPETVATDTDSNNETTETETVEDIVVDADVVAEVEVEVEAEPVIADSIEVEDAAPEPAPESSSGLPLAELQMQFSKQDNNVRLSGYLPDQFSKDILLNQADGGVTIDDAMTITQLADAWPDNWALLSSVVLGQILKLTEAEASITPGRVTISGLAGNHQKRDSVERLLRQSLSSNWVLDMNINIPLSEESIACEVEIQNLLGEETINFNLESWEIDQVSTDLLDSIIDNIQSCAAASFLIEGHTDSIGNDQFNELLSERRALAVKDYLVAKGVDASRIATKGYGATRPIADNNTNEGRSQNRRIEFVVLGESL